MNTRRNIVRLLAVLFIAVSTVGCSPTGPLSPSKPIVTIGAPAHGAQVNVGQEVLVQTNASDAAGIARVELWVDGALSTMAQPPSPQAAYTAVLRWTPATAGAHLIVVKAINVSNLASEPAAVAVSVVAVGVAPNPLTLTPALGQPASSTKTATPEAAVPAACTDNAVFVQHVTVPDGTTWAPGQTFNKIWRVRNTGTCTWSDGYEFVFVGGEAMTTQASFLVPITAPGSSADLLAAMVAPTAPGSHSGQWRLRSPKTGLFGATLGASINVLAPAQPQPQPQGQTGGCAGPPIIASFAANPTTLEVLPTFTAQTTLGWGTVENADSAVIDNGIGGVATPGSTTVALGKTTTFTLTATGCGGTATKQVTVAVKLKTVGPLPVVPACPGPPVITFLTADPSTLEILPTVTGRTTLSWDTKNATDIRVDPWIAINTMSGSRTVDLGKTTTFTFTATGCGGSASKQVTITVKLKTLVLPGP